jgi:hypothetical protein
MGSLNRLAIFKRPDISLAVSKLSQFNQDPTIVYLNAARRILKYAVTTKQFTIKYGYNDGPMCGRPRGDLSARGHPYYNSCGVPGCPRAPTRGGGPYSVEGRPRGPPGCPAP